MTDGQPPSGLHRHEHDHAGEIHRHVHYHDPAKVETERVSERAGVHAHGHGTGIERLTYLVSPMHDLDPRAKLVSALVLIVAVVLAPPPRAADFAGLVALLTAAALIGRLPLRWVFARAALVLPFAGAIALFAPLARAGASASGGLLGAYSSGGWVAAWAILSKAFLSALVMVVVSATTPTSRLIRALEMLRVPDVFIALFSFLYRFADVLRDQLLSLRTALDSRAPALPRLRRWRLLGNLAGNLLLRAYDRGERVHQAMLSRGFTGSLPSAETLALSGADAVLVAVVLLAAAAQALY